MPSSKTVLYLHECVRPFAEFDWLRQFQWSL